MSDLYLTPNRLALLRLGVDGQPDPSGANYWEVIKGRYPDRAHYTVQHNGWLVAKVYMGSDGWRVASRPREVIPAAVLAELPDAAWALLAQHPEEG